MNHLAVFVVIDALIGSWVAILAWALAQWDVR